MATEIKIVWFSNTPESTDEAEKTLGELLGSGWHIRFVAGTTEGYSAGMGPVNEIPTRQRPAGFAVLEKKTGGAGNIR